MSHSAATPAERFLVDWHARHAGASSVVFGPGRTADGRDSYDHLADHAAGARVVLDLACGDGTLLARVRDRGWPARRIGVDLSAAEVVLAHAADPDATVHHARAQALPLPDDHVDCVLSHMALMLMDDVDKVVAEIGRVLCPGGRVAIVVGHGINDALRDVIRAGWQGESHDRPPPMGDPRTRSADELRALLAPLGTVSVEALTLAHEVRRSELPEFLSHAFYGTDSMDAHSREAALRAAPDPLPVEFHLLLAHVGQPAGVRAA